MVIGGLVIGVDGYPNGFVQPLSRTNEARTALRVSLRVSHHGKSLQTVGDVRPVPYLLGEDHPFLEEGCGTVVVAKGQSYQG